VSTKKDNTATALTPEMAKYRDWLIQCDHQASMDFDKAIMTLAGGALAISLAFMREHDPAATLRALWCLPGSWALFTASLLAILASYITSQRGLRKGVEQVDNGTIHQGTAGGVYSTATEWLNLIAAGTFIAGVCCLATFTWLNLEALSKPMGNGKTSNTPPPNPPSATETLTEGYKPPPPPSKGLESMKNDAPIAQPLTVVRESKPGAGYVTPSAPPPPPPKKKP
jgi:hypothetical protein